MPLSCDDDAVEPIVRKTAAWAWRLLVILAALVAVLWVVKRLEIIVVPLLLALMLSALLVPVVDWLDSRGAPRGGAVALVLLSGFAILGGILTFVVSQFVVGLPDLVNQVTRSIDSTRKWLIEGPLHLSRQQITSAGTAAIQALQRNQEKLTSGALSTAATTTEIVTAALLMVFILIFFLYGGRNIWQYVTKIFPTDVRDRVRAAGTAGYSSLTGYIRATFLVALVDAAGVGTGLAIMSVPLALPLASLVFLGAFIPLVGAVISGFLAVVVALLSKGLVYALIALGVIIGVNQLEAHILQPLVMGRAVSIHPLGVVLAISSGGVLGGIPGALLAVPTVAFLNNAFRVLLASEPSAAAVGNEEAGALIQAKPDDLKAETAAEDDAT
jgi:putative heme transporter